MAECNPVLDAYNDTKVAESCQQMAKLLAAYYASLLLAGFQQQEALTLVVAYQNLIILRVVNS